MNLLTDAMEDVILIEKTSEPDGEGGFIPSWKDGARFKAAITFDSSMEALTAKAQGVTSLYTITTRKNAVLKYNDVLRRVSDGKIFRVTSDGDDKFTPNSATINMRQVTAEEWRLQ